MQIDGPLTPEKPSKINDPCSQSDWMGKNYGYEGIRESAQTWTAGGHSKITWFIDSSGAPHSAQIVSPCIPLGLKLFLTAVHPDTSCHKKCFILGGHRTFQQKAFGGETEGP